MNNGYHKNLVFTAACIGMCFFGVSMITLGSVLPSLVTKLGLSGLQTTSLVTFLPLGMLIGSLIFGPIVDRFGHKALLVPSCIIVLSGLEGLIFFESIPLLQLSIVGIGLGGGILNGETNALVSDISGESEKGSRLSFLGMFYGLGALGIPSLLGVLSEHYSFETILQGIGIIMLAGILFCIPVHFPAPKQAQGFPVKEGLGLLKESSLLLLSSILFFQSGIVEFKQIPMYLFDKHLVYKLFRTGDRHPRQSGVNSAYLYGRGAYRGAYAANRDFQKDKTGNRTSLQSYPHCDRLWPADSVSGIYTGRNGYGLGRNGIVIHLSGHLEYSRHPLSRIVRNGIQHSARHSSCRTGCHERAYGNGFRICRRHSILSLYDDRFAHYHAYII